MNAVAEAGPATDALPAAYAPFLPVLERLSEPLLRVIQGQLAQFERLIRNFDAREFAAEGEFEGLGGLTMRGEISHILQSELLLRTEAPLEFLRRLAESEIVFLEKQYADPGAKSVYRATISAGPGILGHGRIVALAAIFFMARVARERGAEFHWCVLPRAEGAVWFDALSVNAIKRFLRAASYREVDVADLEEAGQVWERLEPGVLRDARIRHVDWVIGAAPRRSANRNASRPAVGEAANILCFTLAPPIAGEARSAQVMVRQGGRERARATVQFPDDQSCLSALEDPFRPLKPQRPGAGATGTAIPEPSGWEPEYFIAPNTRVRLVRLDDGLLLLDWAGKARFTQPHFVPIPAGVHLVGARMHERQLWVMVHSVRSGRETLAYGEFRLPYEGPPTLAHARFREVPSEHLFRGRAKYAIPTLNIGNDAEFYSASGQAYRLTFRHSHGEPGFVPLYKAPKTLLANGAYRVTSAEEGGRTILRVVKNLQTRVDDYPTADGKPLPQRLLGMAYSGGDRSLAYSVMPGVWTIPARAANGAERADEVAQELRVAPHETVLAGKANRGRVTARIWSDARYGGEGTVRSVRQETGDMLLRHPPLKLGPDALSIAKILPADDGLWALTVDAEGAPNELLHYKRRSDHKYLCSRFALDDLRARAVEIDLERLYG